VARSQRVVRSLLRGRPWVSREGSKKKLEGKGSQVKKASYFQKSLIGNRKASQRRKEVPAEKQSAPALNRNGIGAESDGILGKNFCGKNPGRRESHTRGTCKKPKNETSPKFLRIKESRRTTERGSEGLSHPAF